MTNGAHAQRKRRLPRETIRRLAWVIGGLSFLAPLTAFALQPKPVIAEELASAGSPPPQIVEPPRLIQVIDPRDPTRPRYVYVPSTSGNGNGNGNGNRFSAPPVTSSGAS